MSPSVNLKMNAPSVNPVRAHLDTLGQAGRTLEKYLTTDSNFPRLTQLMHLSPLCPESYSGLDDAHYRSMSFIASGLPNIKQMAIVNKVPLPPEIMEHFAHMQCHCMMGLFPEIKRAWLTIDSDVYIWTYEHGTDLAYYDGLNEVIISVGLVKPKPNVFFPYVKYLLVLTTAVEIVVLGVRFSSTTPDGPLGALEAIHLLPEPIFVVPTEGVAITTIACTDLGRLFLGGRDGSLFEIEYRAERSWFGKRFNKKNHSTGYLTYLVSSFISALAYGEDDPITQISVDNSRNILFTLSERGCLEVWDLGENGGGMSRVATASQAHIVHSALNIVKTIDAKCFRPVAHIKALEIADSRSLNLVAVAKTGVRLYFSTYLPNQKSLRPSVLTLHHVRMPPGFAANSPSYPPASATMVLYSRGTLMLVTAPGGDKDELWCLSKDLYPWAPCLTEAQTILPLDGKVWAICEELEPGPLSTVSSPEMPDEEPPVIVRQHIEQPRKYVLLTAQGAKVVTKLRPVDLLRQLLVESRGPDTEAVKAFFTVQGEEQACATALVLACLTSQQHAQVADWATRAFFLYGGEPRSAGAQQQVVSPPNQGTPYQHGFAPPLSSTPRGITSGQSPPAVDNLPYVQFSAKHSSLYLYVNRILRPIWSTNIVVKVCPPGKSSILSSSITVDDCVWILGHLHSIKSFLEKHSQFTSSTSSNLFGPGLKMSTSELPAATTVWPGQQRSTLIDAQQEEKNSLCALKAFVTHACEVIGLWKLLCEHQFHVMAEMLDKEIQNHLPSVPFKEVLLVGHALCSLFINGLINCYLGDCASVDSISAKLREVCPNLYRNEDAACSKANEMLLAAKKTTHIDEKESKLKAALNLCKEVAPQIDLPLICQQFAANQFYVGILQLCLTCASKQDPTNVALHWYKNNEQPEDLDGYDAYAKRVEIYKQVTMVLDQLYQQSLSAPGIPSSPFSTSPADSNSAVRPADAEAQAKQILRLALESEDELLHVAVLEWMLRQELYGDLISIDNPSVETFLTRASARSPEAADLLWKYYEKHGNHAAAAKLLLHLACAKGRSLSLTDRVGHLARAVMCMRSDRVGSAPHLGVFLQELEDKMEVAVIQQKVLDAIRAMQGRNPDAEAAILRLNSELLTCNELYEEFAEPLQLWECKLAIIHSTNHNDPELVEEIWQNIVSNECRRHVTWNEKLTALTSKVGELAQQYGQSARCFPLPYLVRALEVIRCKGRCTETAFRPLLNACVSYLSLLQVYEALVTSNERTWAMEGNEFHIIQTVAELASYFTENSAVVPAINRTGLVSSTAEALPKSKTNAYFFRISEIINQPLKLHTEEKTITFQWIAAHCGVIGNEIADKIAQEAWTMFPIEQKKYFLEQFKGSGCKYFKNCWNSGSPVWQTVTSKSQPEPKKEKAK